MKVILFDEEDEKDLEADILKFISDNDPNIIDIKYAVACAMAGEEQIYCFSALILYR